MNKIVINRNTTTIIVTKKRKDDTKMGATKSQINKQNKIREKTNQELLQLLMTYHMANLIRPTGYGKTYHISSLVALFPNKNFLYLYPSEVVANAAKNSIITHAKITPMERIEKPLVDPVALREAVINAVVHNDYTKEVPGSSAQQQHLCEWMASM